MFNNPITRGAALVAGFAYGLVQEFAPFLALIVAGLLAGLVLSGAIALAPLPA